GGAGSGGQVPADLRDLLAPNADIALGPPIGVDDGGVTDEQLLRGLRPALRAEHHEKSDDRARHPNRSTLHMRPPRQRSGRGRRWLFTFVATTRRAASDGMPACVEVRV